MRGESGGAPDGLVLRPVVAGDASQVLDAQRTMAAEDFDFALDLADATDFADYVRLVTERSHGRELRAGWVPSTFLVAVVDGEIVGRISIRHRLNAFLAREGGHIGYAVLPAFRRRGYATAILGLGLVRARELGIGPVLLTCDVENVASVAVIERCGGAFESTVSCEEGGAVRRYWFDPSVKQCPT